MCRIVIDFPLIYSWAHQPWRCHGCLTLMIAFTIHLDLETIDGRVGLPTAISYLIRRQRVIRQSTTVLEYDSWCCWWSMKNTSFLCCQSASLSWDPLVPRFVLKVDSKLLLLIRVSNNWESIFGKAIMIISESIINLLLQSVRNFKGSQMYDRTVQYPTTSLHYLPV